MWPPLYSGHFVKSQSMLFNTNSPLKCGHPSNKDTFTGPKGGRFRGVPLYMLCMCVPPFPNAHVQLLGACMLNNVCYIESEDISIYQLLENTAIIRCYYKCANRPSETLPDKIISPEATTIQRTVFTRKKMLLYIETLS